MQFSATKRDLLRLLSRTQGIASKRSTMPMLTCVLLEASGSELRMSATDLYIGVSGKVSADVAKPGKIAIPAKDLFERVKSMGDGQLTLTVLDNSGVLLKGAGSARKFTVKGMPGDDFPPLPSPDDGSSSLTLEAATLARLISKTSASMSTDETRANLSSTLFEWEGDIVRMVTTDGHRLSKMEVKVDGRQANATMLIPAKGIQELRRLCEDAVASSSKDSPATFSIVQSGPHTFFTNDSFTFCVKLVDSAFPPYAQIIPRSFQRTVTASRSALSDALRAVSIAASDVNGGVKLAIKAGTVEVTSESGDKGQGSDEVSVDLEGQPITIAFNAQYLIEALAAIDSENVRIRLGGDLDPAVIEDDPPSGLLGIAMPQRK